MNVTTYLFGNLGGYFQYPVDYTKGIFRTFCENAKTKTQILVHRDGDLMYYGYIHKLDVDESQYVGMCIVLNSVMFDDIEYLFQTFEKAFFYLVLASEFLMIDDKGEIVRTSAKYPPQEEIEAARNILDKRIQSLLNNRRGKKLPSIDYSKSLSESRSFLFSDSSTEDIIDSSYRYSYTFISINRKDYDTPSISNYKNVISHLKEDKEELNEQYEQLESKYKNLQGEKKQYAVVGYLCVFIVFLGIIMCGMYGIISDKTQRNEYLSAQNKELEKSGYDLNVENKRMKSLNDSIYTEKEKVEKLYADLKSAVHSIPSVGPIIVLDIEVANTDKDGNLKSAWGDSIYRYSGLYLTPRIKYIGIDTCDITLYMNLYMPDGRFISGYSILEMYVKSDGVSYERFRGWGWSELRYLIPGTYSIEVWHGNKCLKTKKFRVL